MNHDYITMDTNLYIGKILQLAYYNNIVWKKGSYVTPSQSECTNENQNKHSSVLSNEQFLSNL